MGTKKSADPAKKKPEEKSRGWFTLSRMAEAFDVTRQAFHDTVRPLISASDLRNAGGKGMQVRCRGAIDAWVEHRIEQAIEASGGEPLLMGDGTPSPAKEELLRIKIGQESIKLDSMRKAIAPIADLKMGLAEIFQGMRRASEAILTRWGPDAAEVLNSELNLIEERLRQMFKDERDVGTPGLGAGSNPAAQGPDAA